MVGNSRITQLNFQYQEFSITLMDKKRGLKVSLGRIQGLRNAWSAYEHMNMGFCLALQEQGMGQSELDNACEQVYANSDIMGVDLLVTRSDLPFDNRWFIAGDIKLLIEAGKLGKIDCPFSETLYDDIINGMQRVLE